MITLYDMRMSKCQFCILFLKIYFGAFFHTFNWTGQCSVDRKAFGEERGERDRQRTTSQDSNSGRSCAVCWRTDRKAIGTD